MSAAVMRAVTSVPGAAPRPPGPGSSRTSPSTSGAKRAQRRRPRLAEELLDSLLLLEALDPLAEDLQRDLAVVLPRVHCQEDFAQWPVLQVRAGTVPVMDDHRSRWVSRTRGYYTGIRVWSQTRVMGAVFACVSGGELFLNCYLFKMYLIY